jgi:uncharacterized protein YndB with AHSA1/START domain
VTVSTTPTPGAHKSHSLVFERQLPHPPEKVWRALTETRLIEQWLLKNDFVAEVGHRFTLHGTPVPGWSGATNCEVVMVDAPRLLAYRWGDGTESVSGLQTLVAWTLTAREGGTLVRMEQSGFSSVNDLSYTRIGGRWPRWLERLAGALDGKYSSPSITRG